MARKLQLRRGTALQWTTANPILAQGEPGFETDTGRFKIGNGSTVWNSLAYQGAAGAAVTSLTPLTPAADQMAYYTSASAAAMTGLTAYARSILAVANEAALKALINAEGGVDFATQAALNSLTTTVSGKQASNARLTDIAGLTLAQGDVLYWNGSNFVKLSPGTSGQYLKTNGAGANPAWADVSQTGRWVYLEKEEPTSDVTSLNFSTNISAYKAIQVNMVGQITTSGDFAQLQIGPGGGTWRTVGLGSGTSTSNGLIFESWQVWNVNNVDGSNLRMAFSLHGANKTAALDRSSATNTSNSAQNGTSGYSSYTETITSVRLVTSGGSFEGSNSDQRTVATLWGLT